MHYALGAEPGKAFYPRRVHLERNDNKGASGEVHCRAAYVRKLESLTHWREGFAADQNLS